MFYTRKGDDGTSGVFGSDKRREKDDPLFNALGTVDELNSLLGICYAKSANQVPSKEVSILEIIRQLQQDLFVVQAELAGADKHITNERVLHLENIIAEVAPLFEPPKGFVIAGANELSAWLDFARSVSRRAERAVIAASHESSVSPDTRIYLNRLSSVLYVLARYAAKESDEKEQNPSY